MSSIRAKFSCTEIIDGGETSQVRFRPVISGSEENRDFFKWTPGGEINLAVVSPSVAHQFKTGHDYYVDFTAAPE
jgi:hypothetical protein